MSIRAKAALIAAIEICITVAVFSGCMWGLTVLRRQDAEVRRKTALQTVSKAETLEEIGKNEKLPAVQGLARQIRENAQDQFERAVVAEVDHETDIMPEAIEPGSPEADENYNEYAGLTKAKVARRKALKPSRLLNKVGATVLEIIPWWLKALVVGCLLWGVLTTGVAFKAWVRNKFHVRQLAAKDQALDEYDDAMEKLPRDQRREVGKGDALKREHFVRNEMRRQRYDAWQGEFLPKSEGEKVVEEGSQRLNEIGEHLKHEEEDTTDE